MRSKEAGSGINWRISLVALRINLAIMVSLFHIKQFAAAELNPLKETDYITQH